MTFFSYFYIMIELDPSESTFIGVGVMARNLALNR